MADALVWHRLQFAFTAIYHYIFPQLTIGLALLIVVLKALHLRPFALLLVTLYFANLFRIYRGKVDDGSGGGRR